MATNPNSARVSVAWYVAATVIIVIIIAVGIITYEVTLPKSPSVIPSSTPAISPSSSPVTSPSTSPAPSVSPSSTGTTLTLYAGSVTSGSGTYGFGDSASSITSPGPTLNLKVGTTYTMTVNNVGNLPHSWEISSTKAVSSSPMFGAGIDTTSYISPGSTGSVTFTPNQAGNYYYVCTVPGHTTLGMWGNVVVTG